MKKDTKSQKLLTLSKETIRKLADDDLKNVIGAGGGSCLPPPRPES